MARIRQRARLLICLLVATLLACTLCVTGALYLRRYSVLSHPAAVLHGEQHFAHVPVSDDTLDLTLASPQAFVYDVAAGELIYQKGERRVLYPASTTKLLTVLCALEHLSPDELVTPGEELSLVAAGSSLAYVKEHHTLTVEMLVQGMLMPSGNDAAYALAAAAGHRIDAQATGRAAIDVFVNEMNRYATELGLVGTNFISPDGLSGEQHYSTVEDILIVARLAAQNDLICRYAAMAEADVTYASGHTNRWVNTNELLHASSPYYRPTVTGLKTGSLEHNYCLICTVEQDGRSYIIGLFGAWEKADRYTDACRVIDTLFPTE